MHWNDLDMQMCEWKSHIEGKSYNSWVPQDKHLGDTASEKNDLLTQQLEGLACVLLDLDLFHYLICAFEK